MNQQRILMLIILLGLAFASLLFERSDLLSPELITRFGKSEQDKKNTKPEFRVKNFTNKRFDKTGNLETIVEAEKFTSFEAEQETQIFEPTIYMFSGDQPAEWEIESRTAKSTYPNTEIFLETDVVMKKLPASEGELTATIFSDEMWVNNEEKIAKTSSAVKIISEANIIEGEGLEAFLNEEKLNILANIRSKYLNKGEKDEQNQEVFTLISSDNFSFDYSSNIASYKNNVELKYKNISITADRIDVIRGADSHTAYAYGSPSTFTQNSKKDKKIIHANAKRFEFNNREQILKMFESAQLDQNGAIVKGDYLYYNTQSETIGAESNKDSRVKMVLPVK